MAFPTGWNRKVKLTIQSSKVTATLTDFPVLITKDTIPTEVLDADGSFPAKSDGGDIRITTDEAGLTQIPVEIQEFAINNDPALGTAVIHAKVPSISSLVDTDIWLWYNNPSATLPADTDTYGRDAVWSNNFDTVFHLHEGDSTAVDFYKDATGNGNHGQLTDIDGDSAQIDGKFGKMMDLTGDADFITTGDISFGANFTISAWIKSDDVTPYRQGVVGKASSAINSEIYLGTGSTNIMLVLFKNAGTQIAHADTIALDTNWHLFHGVADGTNVTLYKDGSAIASPASQTVNPPSLIRNMRIGHDDAFWVSGGDRYFAGIVGEVRKSSVARSSDWNSAEYNNQNDPATFIIEGTPVSTVTVGNILAQNKSIARNVLLRR